MSYNTIIEHINHGNYQIAAELLKTNKLSKPVRLTLESRISELNGKFEDAFSLAEFAIAESSRAPEKLEALIALAYSFWRLNKGQKAYDAIIEGEHIIASDNIRDKKWLYLHGNLLNIKGLVFWKQ
ncbi:MAG: hypothetical protein ACXAD7_18875, partial [Candidatus Kariarchaeaceae archaeon]